jgi:hypothetical protein
MKTRFLFALLFVLLVGSAFGQTTNRITAIITVTNTPVFNQSVTIGVDTRTWTNSVTGSPGTTILIGADKNISATNLFNGISRAPFSGPLILSYNGTNSIKLVGQPAQQFTVSFSGLWGSVSYSTQVVATMFGVRVPVAGEAVPSVRTNVMSMLLTGLQDYPSNTMSQTSLAFTNYLGTTNAQTISVGTKTWLNTNLFTNSIWMDGMASNIALVLAKGTVSNASLLNVNLTNGSLDGFNLGKFTNGTGTNTILVSPKFTNAINYGNAFSSPRTNVSNSEQFGAGATALSLGTTAVGYGAIATNTYATAFGQNAWARGSLGVAIGPASAVEYGADNSTAVGSAAYIYPGVANAVALGTGATVTTNSGSAIGANSLAQHIFSTAIGFLAQTSASNQVMLGSSSISTYVNSLLQVGVATTNITFAGTNVWRGSLAFKSTANAILANGDNVPFPLGTNVFTRLSGATTIANLQGFTEEPDGAYHIIRISGSITNRIYNELGGAPAAQRINTGTGGDLISTNSPTWLTVIYDATAARWNVISIR